MAKGNRHFQIFCEDQLLDGEKVVAWTPAIRDGKGFEGIAVLTDRRVAFFRKGVTSIKFEPWPVSKITSIETRRGLLFYDVVLHTSGDEMTFKIGERERGERFVKEVQEVLNGQPAPGSADAGTGQNPLDQLEKLARLREMGAISDDEFEAKKRVLLAQM